MLHLWRVLDVGQRAPAEAHTPGGAAAAATNPARRAEIAAASPSTASAASPAAAVTPPPAHAGATPRGNPPRERDPLALVIRRPSPPFDGTFVDADSGEEFSYGNRKRYHSSSAYQKRRSRILAGRACDQCGGVGKVLWAQSWQDIGRETSRHHDRALRGLQRPGLPGTRAEDQRVGSGRGGPGQPAGARLDRQRELAEHVLHLTLERSERSGSQYRWRTVAHGSKPATSSTPLGFWTSTWRSSPSQPAFCSPAHSAYSKVICVGHADTGAPASPPARRAGRRSRRR